MKRLKVHYAWIILVLTFLALLAAQGVRLSFGAFMAPWEHEFSANRSVISFIAFVSYIVFAISQPYVGRLIDKYGIRYILSFSILVIGFSTLLTFFTANPVQLMIIYGVIASVGFGGASNVAGTMAVATWFADKKGMAMGLMSAGTAAGQLILVPLSLFLIDLLGWKTTVLVLGFFLIVIIFPLLLLFIRSNPADLQIDAYGANVSDSQKGRQGKRKHQKERFPYFSS